LFLAGILVKHFFRGYYFFFGAGAGFFGSFFLGAGAGFFSILSSPSFYVGLGKL